MANPIIISAKIRSKENKLTSLLNEIDVINKRAEEVVNSVNEAETDEEIDVLEEQMEEISKEIDDKTKLKGDLEEEIDNLKKELDELNNKKPKLEEKGERAMSNNVEVRSNLNNYFRSKGQVREGVKIVDGGALILTENLKPQIAPNLEVDLTKLVSVVKVNTGSGKYPVINKSGKKMTSVSELEKNPNLGKFKPTPVEFSIETYRGNLAVSQEVIDDADYDILGLIEDDIALQELNTKNHEISAILKTATAKNAQGLDGLKDMINKEIKSVYNVVMVVSDSLFAALDKVKDKQGRYMLQPDVTSPTGYKFSGKVIYRLPDDVIADGSGEMKGFIGDPEAFCILFDRLQTTAKWVDNEIYGQILGIYTRFDVKKADNDAGVYVTYTDAL